MTIVYIIAIILQLGIFIYFVRRGMVQAKKARANVPVPEESYESLRALALSVTAAQLKLAIPADTTFVYGVLMDWNLDESVMTLAAYITGAANMYLSTGARITGGGKNPDAGEAAVAFVVAAQDFLERAMQVSNTGIPPKGCVRFYLLTNSGLYGAQEQMARFEDASSPWFPLFEAGSALIGEIRNIGNGIPNEAGGQPYLS